MEPDDLAVQTAPLPNDLPNGQPLVRLAFPMGSYRYYRVSIGLPIGLSHNPLTLSPVKRHLLPNGLPNVFFFFLDNTEFK